MTVKELRELATTLPDGMTQDDFDCLEVRITNGEIFDFVDSENSGVITFSGACDEDGNEIESDGFEDEISLFCLFASGYLSKED